MVTPCITGDCNHDLANECAKELGDRLIGEMLVNDDLKEAAKTLLSELRHNRNGGGPSEQSVHKLEQKVKTYEQG